MMRLPTIFTIPVGALAAVLVRYEQGKAVLVWYLPRGSPKGCRLQTRRGPRTDRRRHRSRPTPQRPGRNRPPTLGDNFLAELTPLFYEGILISKTEMAVSSMAEAFARHGW
jgi:hypothetical protein